MPLLDKVKGLLRIRPSSQLMAVSDHERQEVPSYFAGEYRFAVGESNRANSNVLLKNFQGWQAIAARAIADRIQSLEPLVYVKRPGQDSRTKYYYKRLDDHPLKNLLDFPTFPVNVFTRLQLFRIAALWLVQTGESYFVKVRDSMGIPRQLWPLSPDRMELVTSSSKNPVIGYVFHSDRRDVEYKYSDIVRIWSPDPVSIFAGVGALGPNWAAYDISKYGSETIRTYYENDATPKSALIAKPEAPQPTDKIKKRFAIDWRKRYNARRGTFRGIPPFIPPGFDIKTFDPYGGIGDNIEVFEHFRDQILMACGVPRSILGDVVDANRAAAETNQWVFDRHTILPLIELISDALTTQLARDFDPRLIVMFEDFVADDKYYDMKLEDQDARNKILSVNEIRKNRGLDPVEWGEYPVGTPKDAPYTGEEKDELEVGEDESSDDEETPGDEETQESSPNEDDEATSPKTKAARRRMRRHRVAAYYGRPNPKKFKSKSKFMSACVSTVVGEGKDQDQAVAQCLSMWNNKGKKKK